jgi:hypothetical protein
MKTNKSDSNRNKGIEKKGKLIASDNKGKQK